MYKIIDIVGFYIKSSKCCVIEKIKNISTNNITYIICFSSTKKEDEYYYINQDISSFFNKLKGNGSGIYKENNDYILKGRKLHNNYGRIYDLECYKNDPFNMPLVDSIRLQLCNLTLYEIMDINLDDISNFIIS